MVECPKCGHKNSDEISACIDCSWPFASESWKTTKYRVERVTVDTSCINAKQLDPDLNRIEEWAKKGRLILQRSDVLLYELRGAKRIAKANQLGKHPPVWKLGFSHLGVDTNLAGPDMKEALREILFPTTSIVTENQEHDIEHLRSHVITGGDVFVTRNPEDFIVRGKQSQLSQLGIWVFTPAELVTFLGEIYEWT